MMKTEEIRAFPLHEKMRMMEVLWASLAQDGDVPSPDWHGSALAESAQRYAAGEEKAVDWESARQQLRSE